jgi:hypothetical protein
MKLVVVTLMAITLNNAALYLHYEYANKVYEKCYENINYNEDDIEICMKKDKTFRIIGTLLFTEGTYLEEIL